VRHVEIIPIEIVVRNIVAGSLAKRLGIAEGTPLSRSIVEYYHKNAALGDPLVSEEHITAFGWAATQDLDEIMQMSLRINDFLMGLFLGVGLKLIDFKLEYGRLYDNDEMRIVLADEISPEQLPALGHQDQREDGQGPLPPRSGPGRGSLSGSGAPARHSARRRTHRFARPANGAMKARVHIMPRDGVLDPQGKAIAHALASLGFAGVGEVRPRQSH